MQTFPFNIQKWSQFPPKQQHKWLKKWLKNLYVALQNKEVSPKSLALIQKQWEQLHKIAQFEPILFPDIHNTKAWLILLADQYHFHQQKTGIGKQEADFLPTIEEGDRIAPQLDIPPFNYVVAMDNVRSAFNVGSIYRTAEACRFQQVIHGGITPPNTQRQVNKTARHTVEHIDSYTCTSLSSDLKQKKIEGYAVIGIETAKEAVFYQEYSFPKQAIILLGNEEYGIQQTNLAICDAFLKIPMLGRKRSLNVAHAFSIIAYAMISQHINIGTLSS